MDLREYLERRSERLLESATYWRRHLKENPDDREAEQFVTAYDKAFVEFDFAITVAKGGEGLSV